MAVIEGDDTQRDTPPPAAEGIRAEQPAVPRVYHVLAAALVSWCVWSAARQPAFYEAAMQEDRAVEWATVWFFAAAGVMGLSRAIRRRRVFDGLVALFCLVFAGEEMSWGQRLFGLTPPSYFLEHNTQQEMNIHNFGAVFGSPRWPFVVVLIGYCVVMPLVGRTRVGRALLARIGASPPPPAVIPWLALGVVLLVWYPLKFTGEWVELLEGSAFFVALGMTARAFLATSGAGAAAALLLAAWSARGSSDPALLACARDETQALAENLRASAPTSGLLGGRSIHKRAWTLAEENYVDADVVRLGATVGHCGPGDAGARRRFAVDPWGTAYWVRVTPRESATTIAVYSFGPNRRRDHEPGSVAVGDDIISRVEIGTR